MANIDSLDAITKLDPDGFLQYMQEFPDQCERAWSDWKNIPLPTRFIQAKSILISGMGGSGIPGELAGGFARTTSNVPIVTWHDYGVPDWVNKDTLVIAVSVSGNTEETVDCLKKAAEKTDKIITTSTGGDLEILSRKFKTTHYKVNYDGPPRAALGYNLTTVFAILAKLRIIELSDDDMKEAIVMLRAILKKIDASVPTPNNNAKLLALKLEDKIPIVMGAGTMAQVARRWCGDFNENSKVASYFQEIPENNHNSLVGLEFPKLLGQKIFVIMLNSRYDLQRNQIREKVMLSVYDKRRIPTEAIMIEPAPSSLSEMLQVIFFGSFTSYYLGMLNDVNPTKIEMVDYLKEKLAETPLE